MHPTNTTEEFNYFHIGNYENMNKLYYKKHKNTTSMDYKVAN